MLHATRGKMSLFTSIVNIVATVGFVFLMEYLFGKVNKFDWTYMAVHNTLTCETYYWWYMYHYLILIQGYDQKEQYYQIINPIMKNASSTATVAMLSPALIAIACALICYYCCALASKLLMQEVSYALPLFLATPTVAAIIVLQVI